MYLSYARQWVHSLGHGGGWSQSELLLAVGRLPISVGGIADRRRCGGGPTGVWFIEIAVTSE